jgi:hypothetical protein
MPYEGPGIYRHYKGGFYRVIGIAEHESNGTRLVIYHSYNIEHDISQATRGNNFIARPLNAEDGDDAWNTPVEDNRARFVKLRFDTFDLWPI